MNSIQILSPISELQVYSISLCPFLTLFPTIPSLFFNSTHAFFPSVSCNSLFLTDAGPLHILLLLPWMLSLYLLLLIPQINHYYCGEVFNHPLSLGPGPLSFVCLCIRLCNFYVLASTTQNTAWQQKWCQYLLSVISPAITTGTQWTIKNIFSDEWNHYV